MQFSFSSFPKVVWALLLFLLAFCVEMVVVKALAAVAALLVLFWGFRKKEISLWGAPAFYFLMPLFILLTTPFILPTGTGAAGGQWVASAIAMAYWLASGVAFLLLRYAVQKRGTPAALHLWFGINAMVSLVQLGYTIWLAGGHNPYRSSNFLLGNSTGDYIKGAFLGPCYLNAFVNAFFVFYFLMKGKARAAFGAAVILCLTSSNFLNLIFLPLLWVFAIANKGKWKSALAQTALFLVFYGGFSNGNFQYVVSSVERIFVSKKNTPKVLPLPPVASRPSGVAPNKDALFQSVVVQPAGKIVAFKQTVAYLLSGIQPALIGAGAGNFSSQLALRLANSTVPKGSRLFQKLPRHTAEDYKKNHLRLYEIIYSMPMEYHSIQHMPGSFGNQILGEYGLIGFAIFLFGYVLFFLKRWRQLTWSRYVLLLLGAFLFFDYGFEYLSVMVFGELFFLEDLRRQKDAARPSLKANTAP